MQNAECRMHNDTRRMAGVAFFAQRGYNIEKGGGRMTKIEKLKKWIDESKRIVFFGGAGVSTELC